ncbi:hypothetical protein CK203_027929 [Vitis vinifera]|uniref:UBA domain-containing protein n=1 Tax=Vitis vinifera TaxID=29760 RepID=A0A438J3Q4_VITVI|nr:hypothetical protein CK203_027929 [Vitis vinifera]
MEREQLLSMGFPDDLASQALAATGGKSILKATEWILGRNKSDSQTPDENPNSSPSPSPFQPKLDRFFHFQSKPSNPPKSKNNTATRPHCPVPPPNDSV